MTSSATAPVVPSVDLDEVTIVYPLLGRGAKGRFEASGMTGAGQVVSDRRGNARGIVALHAVSLGLTEGDRVGLIGRNGSGKSTLLRTIGGIYPPYSGRMRVQGSIAGLYSAGLGMRGEASGHRNIELLGLVAGFSREEVAEIAPRIAAFTELGDYLNMPVRTYSNGMSMRLKFACATAYSPQILLMDEWLGAGDPAFQAKAQARMDELVEKAGIMVLASHNHNQIKSTCDKAVWLDRGILKAAGPAAEVVAYSQGDIKAEEVSADVTLAHA